MKVCFEFWFDDTDSEGCYWKGYPTPGILRCDFARCWHINPENVEDVVRRHSNILLDLPIDDSTTLIRIQNMILQGIGMDPAETGDLWLFLRFLIEDNLIYVDKEDMPIGELWNHIKRPDILHCLFVFTTSAGDVYREDNLRFYMHSNEQGHNTPHVHVSVGNEKELSVSIPGGEWLAGYKPNRKVWKRIRTIIADNKEKFLLAWNLNTNGISTDLNYNLGLVR